MTDDDQGAFSRRAELLAWQKAMEKAVTERARWRSREDTVLALALRAREVGLEAVALASFTDAEWKQFREDAGIVADPVMCAEAVDVVLRWEALNGGS